VLCLNKPSKDELLSKITDVKHVSKESSHYIFSFFIYFRQYNKCENTHLTLTKDICEICLPSDGFVERLLHVNRYEFFYEYVINTELRT
jgi:hypothetical protein